MLTYVRTRAANPAGFVMKGAAPAANYVINTIPSWHGQRMMQLVRKLDSSASLSFLVKVTASMICARWSGVYGGTSPTPDYVDRVVNAYLRMKLLNYLPVAFTGASFTDANEKFLPLPQGQIDLIDLEFLTQNPGF